MVVHLAAGPWLLECAENRWPSLASKSHLRKELLGRSTYSAQNGAQRLGPGMLNYVRCAWQAGFAREMTNC